ncbi:protein kinase [Spirillospora sp. NPDC029432]|uniref:serine/threonine-protein kinase n=1 Tax=Spirillospora sp. NPDC029432 TaxID=3154599 RepID=UPI003456510D
MAEGHLLAGRYRLDAVVGRGGMGTVWRAYDVMLDREVAVKEVVLPPGLGPDEHELTYKRTFREARASARLNHPGVVTVHDVVEEADRPWIVMELVHARSLQDVLEEGLLEHRRVAEIGLQMLGALRHAHEKGILHRDVKPSNVLITDAGRVVLTDFGIAQVEGDATLTQTGLVMGSPAYIPPERAQGERAVPASDLWALGATMYAALEGRSPYERSDAMSSLQAALIEPVPPPRNAGPLRAVLDGLLAREPARRITAAQAEPMLDRVATMPRPVAPPPPPPRPRTDETLLDEPLRAYEQTVVDEPADTILDSAEFEEITRPDSGTGSASHAPPGPPPPAPPSRPPTGPPARPQAGPPSRPSQYGRPEEPRTLLETEWAPPPEHGNRAPGGQVPGAGAPQTPPPWEQPAQSRQWQQPRPPTPVLSPREKERRKTIVIVTIAVILVVAAVLGGALIIRMKINGGAGAAGEVRVEAVRGA